ncbi:MAG: UDP-N-acetylglucosamine 2-epimerase (non-hydrolyzing), partial [Gammaproteobacteria bacterium]|nr:UDP-N-acetylglucosamine 2-epimerase (non-hydrolyzing) [Gammaproteobacteria bacterium]
SFDHEMREERNRIVVDAIAHHLFTYTECEADYLRRSPELRGRIDVTGNTTVDLIDDFRDRLGSRRDDRYAFVTLHRKELTDRPLRLAAVFRGLARLAERFDTVLFPMHPRTRDMMMSHHIDPSLLGSVVVTEPVSGLEALALQRHAAVVVTDSGCLQEEAYILGVPCVTVRENTERHQTILHGGNRLVGFDPDAIAAGVETALSRERGGWPPIYGRSGAGDRIVAHLLDETSSSTAADSETVLDAQAARGLPC